MTYSVKLTADAIKDIQDIVDYIALNDSKAKALNTLEKLRSSVASLSESPERGAYPNELTSLGIKEFRQIQTSPYRCIYRIINTDVFVLIVADGRRDMQALLQRRLLQG